ncbi:MAG: VWA domain-containing protein [Gammaproteobacteria bacterium]
MNFEDFHFLRPEWFVLLVPLALLCWRYIRRRDAAGVWQSICDEALLPYILVKRNVGRSPLNIAVFMISGITAIIALAGPTWERLPTPVFRDESAMVLLLDLSRSMDATDISPSRLDRAKFKITDILRQRRDGQTALIVYAAEPYVVTPLTNDVATIESQLPALRTGIMPSQGSNGDKAVERGIALLNQGGMTNGELLLITDGLGPLEVDRAKNIIAANGIRLSVLGVGTPEGAPIPDKDGGFIKDVRGNIVLEPLRPAQLRELANAGRGLYQTVRTDEKDVSAILTLTENELNQRNASTTDMFADRWLEVGPWFLLMLIPLAPLAFRRGVLILTFGLGCTMLSYPHNVSARWWATPDQEAQHHFDRDEFAAAADKFENKIWRTSAQYRAGSYEEALAGIADDANAEAQYNKGNALARLGRFEEAIAAYDKTLSKVSEHEDALHNKELLEELLEQQNEQQQEEQSPDRSDENPRDKENAQDGGQKSNDQAERQESDEDSKNKSESSAEFDNELNEKNEPSMSDEHSSEEAKLADEPEATPKEEKEGDEIETEPQALAQKNSDMESAQATEQWLRQIPDDPGGLLRRKFEYEYQKKYGRQRRRANSW